LQTKTPNVWVIADTHFGHYMLRDANLRPRFFEEDLLRSIRASVEPGDLLIHLGDFCFGDDAQWASAYSFATVGATRVLVRGNHDSKSNAWYRAHGFHFVCQDLRDTYFGKRILFSHEPRSVDAMEAIVADLNVHGHTHGNAHRDDELPSRVPGLHLEVACETLGYGPVSLRKLLNA